MPDPTQKQNPAPEVSCYVALRRAADSVLADLVPLLKQRGLSEPKYNVLRILRGAAGEGLACQQIGKRMITRVPDVTRLIDRLERHQLVARERDPKDRRLVIVRATPAALELLADLDAPLLEAHRAQFARLSTAELGELERLLRKLSRAP